MKILVVGGLGYIGGRLAHFLKEHRGDARIYLSSTRKEYPAWTKDFPVKFLDLTRGDSIEKCVYDVAPDVVIHLGAMPQFECLENPQKALDVNARGTARLLEIAGTRGVKQFIYFSTFQVYGKLVGTISEKNPWDPQNPYAQSKLEAENFIRAYDDSKGMRTLILRLSNAYGFPMDEDVNVWHLVFNAFCKQCLENQEIKIRSNQYRDFIAMNDVLRAVDYFLFGAPDQWQDGVFNLGGDRCWSVLEVARRVAKSYEEIYGGGPIPVGDPLENPEVEEFTYSIDKLKSTGFCLKENMDEEIVGTLKVCEAMLKRSR